MVPARERIIPAYAGSTSRASTPAMGSSDHPRIRGEHRRRRPHPDVDRGSSPHTRGALRRPQGSDRGRRIIPAYAGSTVPARRACRPWRDHPRIRGEHAAAPGSCLASVGSSPHTRGALSLGPATLRRRRIIPAYAGSTRRRSPASAARADHPRIRGEHVTMSLSGSCMSGSSPHTRGAPGPDRTEPGKHRIIPAYAGSTPRPRAVRMGRLDHPRIRGEHLHGGETVCKTIRIIPAYAGSTRRFGWLCGGHADHPRIRGEHASSSLHIFMHLGSSPHTRGARQLLRTDAFGRGIIPAYAGSTSPERYFLGAVGDHPRIRGEHVPVSVTPVSRCGSSPHTRGAR